MRLIDADKLEADVEYWENHDDPKKLDYDTRDIEQVIGFQPTVEAIPIEWIEKYNNENWFDAGTQYNAVTCMLDQWREENAR